MNRSISLSEHHARRRKARAQREQDGSSSSGDSSQGVAHDAACFGVYETPRNAPSSAKGRRNNNLVDAEHASYAAEPCIGFYEAGAEHPSLNKGAQQRLPSRGIVSPPRGSFSSPDVDMEDHYSSVSRYSKYDDSCVSNGGGTRYSLSNYGSSKGSTYATHSASDDSFVSVDVGGSDASTIATSTIDEGRPLSPCSDEADAIKAGIVDISAFIASWIAGGLSFIIGIFLALLSPIIRLIKIIFGDLTGLIGDAFGLALRNNPGLIRDLEGLRRMFKNSRDARWRRGSRDNQDYNQGQSSYNHQSFARSSSHDDCEASMTSHCTHETSYYSHGTDEGTHSSPQYVGGWSPSIASSRGSNSRESYPSNGSTGYRSTANRSRSSKSYSSLPQVQEDDVASCPSYPYYPDDVSVGTSLSTDSRRLMHRVGMRNGGFSRVSRRASNH